MSAEAIYPEMRALLADSLALPVDRVKPESRLIDDLGADSLDLVDILFRVEKKFGVKVRTNELAFLSNLDFSSPTVMKGGHLTPEAVERLKEWLPSVSELGDPSKITPAKLFSLINVEVLCRIVAQKLAVACAPATAS